MDRSGLIPVMTVAIINGIFSPWVLVVFVLYPVWYPSWAPATTQFVYMASALVLSTFTVMASGVPAALYKKLSSAPSQTVAATIWLACALLLALPSIPNVLTALGLQ